MIRACEGPFRLFMAVPMTIGAADLCRQSSVYRWWKILSAVSLTQANSLSVVSLTPVNSLSVVSLKPVNNLSLVSTTPVITFFPGVVDTGQK